MDNNLRQTLAQVLKEVNAPVEKLDKNTYVINGVIVKHIDDHWVLVSKFLPRTVIAHSKIAVVLPWMLDRRNMRSWINKDKILQLDKKYAWALFKVENQRRIMSRAIKNKQHDKALIMFDKLEHSKAKLRSINSEIAIAINGVKINK